MLMIMLAVLGILLGVLAIPIGVAYQVSWRGTFQSDIQLTWLFGLLRVHIPIAATSSSASRKLKSARPRHHRQGKARHKANPLAAWRLRSFRQRLIRFVQDLWHAIHKRDLRVQLRVGLGDPADTGQLWALMGPLSALLTQSEAVVFQLEPDFVESTLEFSSSGQIRIIPLQLIGFSLALLMSPPFWQGVQHMRRAG